MERLIETALESTAEDFEEIYSSDDSVEIEVWAFLSIDLFEADFPPEVHLPTEYSDDTHFCDRRSWIVPPVTV
jgi:hypothetical protein